MRVLVVGGRGMLGTDLVSALEPVCEVRGCDLPETDITRPADCRRAIRAFRPAVVINAAALARVDYCESNQAEAHAVNAEGAGNLAREAHSAGALFVHYSTDYVFDGRKGAPYLETDAPNPQNAYGRSKLAGEELVRRHSREHLILRTSWLFGPHGPNFIRTIAGAAARGESLRVVTDQEGSPTYTGDLARHTLLMIERGCRSVYHVTNGGHCTWYELAVRALEWLGLANVPVAPVPTSAYPLPACRPAFSVLENARLAAEGLPLMRPWQAAARAYIEGHLSKPGSGGSLQL